MSQIEPKEDQMVQTRISQRTKALTLWLDSRSLHTLLWTNTLRVKYVPDWAMRKEIFFTQGFYIICIIKVIADPLFKCTLWVRLTSYWAKGREDKLHTSDFHGQKDRLVSLWGAHWLGPQLKMIWDNFTD